MNKHPVDKWRHRHEFTLIHQKGEKRTLYVLLLTAAVMIVEIIAGTAFGSMALLADGWHMATHTAAFLITLFAYRHARLHRNDPAYAFGTGKVSVLGGFASAVALAMVALFMVIESTERFFEPRHIRYNEAIAVAMIGLLVNLVSAGLLHHTGENHGSDRYEKHSSSDHNLRGAYVHVLADAVTSILALIALGLGSLYALGWLDPAMGMAGAVIIFRWSFSLLRETGAILLDRSIGSDRFQAIRTAVEKEPDNQIADMHVWKVGPRDYAAILSVVTHSPRNPDHYKALLRPVGDLSHVTIEVNRCDDPACDAPGISA